MHDTTPLKIYVCEDDRRLRGFVVRLIDAEQDMVVSGQAGDGETTLRDLRTRLPLPDLLVLDLELPGISGLDLLDELGDLTAEMDVLILTSFADSDAVFRAMRAGAAGYVVKSAGLARLVEAVREVSRGGTVIDPQLARRFWHLFQANVGHEDRDPYGLLPRERQVLELLAKGLTNPEMGKALGITRRSVKGVLESIYRKMKVNSRVEAVVAAVRAGLVRPG